MKNILRAVLLAPLAGLILGGCTEVFEFFGSEDPADASNCEYVTNDSQFIGLLCVECDSGNNDQASIEQCGVEITARCNSKLTNDVYGIALGNIISITVPVDITFAYLTGTAWYDEDGDGADDDDTLICHEQSTGTTQSKQEWKCTSELTGNGKNDTTFEVEVKYDESKNDCL